MITIDKNGELLTVGIIEECLGQAWVGKDHATSIAADRETLGYVSFKVFPGMIPRYQIKFLGAVLVEDATVPPGEIEFRVPGNSERSVRLTNIKIAPVPAVSVHRRPETVLETHSLNVSETTWNELWNQMSPEDRFMDDTSEIAIFLMTPFGRKLRITRNL